MIGDRYWATGITLRAYEDYSGKPEAEGPAWSVSLNFYDDGFCNTKSTQGSLRLRYVIPNQELASAIDTPVPRRLSFHYERTP